MIILGIVGQAYVCVWAKLEVEWKQKRVIMNDTWKYFKISSDLLSIRVYATRSNDMVHNTS